MASSASAPRDIPSAMSKLSISGSTTAGSTVKSSKPKAKAVREVADSWEDDVEEEGELESPKSPEDSVSASPSGFTSLSRQTTDYNPKPPPPTPASPAPLLSYSELSASGRFPSLDKTTSNTTSGLASPSPNRNRAQSSAAPEKRPEKTTAAASRLIAAGLGLKAPKRTEAEREYDRVARQAERQKKEKAIQEAKLREEEAKRAKDAVWED